MAKVEEQLSISHMESERFLAYVLKVFSHLGWEVSLVTEDYVFANYKLYMGGRGDFAVQLFPEDGMAVFASAKPGMLATEHRQVFIQ